jgi:tetratricopeptide (TPR) repeat protein
MQGQALLDDLHFLDAHEKFAQAIDVDPEFAMAHMMLAQTAQTTAEFFDAIGKAAEYAANASDGEKLYIRASVAASENDQDGQKEALAELVAMYPQDERPHMRMGYFLNGQQDFAGAIEHYKHAVAINPDFAGAYNTLGYAYRGTEEFDNAKAAFAKYVELIPDEANPYDSYAELLLETGDYDASIENYRKALEIDPNFGASYAGISVSESLKGNADLAQAAADRMLAAARNPGERQAAMFQSVTAHLFAGNTDAALEVCNTMLAEAEVKGNHYAMGRNAEYMGDIMLAMGESTKAEAYFNTALDYRLQAGFNEANQDQAERTHLFKTAIASMIAGNSDAAATRTAEYNAAAEMNGTAFERLRIHELSAYLAMNNEEFESAARHFAQASQLNPIVLYWSAVTNEALGNTELAIDLATRAANRNTLSGNLPFFRSEAQKLFAKLTAEPSGDE